MADKPRIGFTTSNDRFDMLHRLIGWSISLSGGNPVRIRTNGTTDPGNVDGLIIGGGTDILPVRYSSQPDPLYKYDPQRDEMEISLLETADKLGIPVLGICRGAQMLNVYRGGSLHMDVAKVFQKATYPRGDIARILYRKPIQIAHGSLLSRIFQMPSIQVNSMHRQAIDKTGSDLVVSAYEHNGSIQAVEDPKHPFIMGVQFHPEALIYRRSFRQLFARFIEAARGRGRL